jgi:alpha-glucosidase
VVRCHAVLKEEAPLMMRSAGEQEEPIEGSVENSATVFRRGILKGVIITAGTAAGMGVAWPAYAADASVRATSPDGRTVLTLSVVGGALQWSVLRSGTTVIATSPLGLRLRTGRPSAAA